MDFNKITEEISKGKLVVWKDDISQDAMTEEYMKDNFVGLADNLEEAAKLCRDLQDAERDSHGRALTRLRITGTFDDYVCAEDSEVDVKKWIKK
jgi:hypothetical protein